MSEKDLRLFLYKVEQLREMVDSLDLIPERRKTLCNCNTHEEVVLLAKSWGYEIGRRWGEDDPKDLFKPK